MKKVENYCFKK